MKKNIKNMPKLAPSYHLIDTHCHLDMSAFGDDLPAVIRRATDNQVRRIITIGIDLQSSGEAVALARRYPEVSATIGIHPHDVDNIGDEEYLELEKLYAAQEDYIVGFGEIGLDYVKKYSTPAAQREHFSRQIDLAHSLKLPIIVHNREANSDTIRLLKEAGPLDHGGIMHCFSGDYEFAQKVLDLGMLISIPGIITFKNADHLHKVAQKIPLEHLVLETDGPFLAPHPYRGKRNEPSYLLYTAETVARLRNLPLEDIALQTTENAENLFKFKNLQPKP